MTRPGTHIGLDAKPRLTASVTVVRAISVMVAFDGQPPGATRQFPRHRYVIVIDLSITPIHSNTRVIELALKRA